MSSLTIRSTLLSAEVVLFFIGTRLFTKENEELVNSALKFLEETSQKVCLGMSDDNKLLMMKHSV